MPDLAKQELASTIHRQRMVKGLTQEELAVLCNVAPTAIAAWENGERMPGTIDRLKTLCQRLDISLDAVLRLGRFGGPGH